MPSFFLTSLYNPRTICARSFSNRPCSFCFVWFEVLNFLYISLGKTCEIQGGPILGPQGHNLNKLGRGFLDDAT